MEGHAAVMGTVTAGRRSEDAVWVKHLPSLRDAAELAVAVSTMLSRSARVEYDVDRHGRIQAADARLSTEELPQIVSGAHELAGMFLLASGDFVHAVHGLLLQELDLVYSTASLGRSAVEYAAKSWWLLEPGISFEEQACRVVAAFRAALDAEQRLSGASDEVDELRRVFDRWEEETGLKARKGLPPTLQILLRMAPADAESHWRHLSGTVHGGALEVLRAHQSVLGDLPSHRYEHWYRVIVAGGYGLQAIAAYTEAAGTVPDMLDEVRALHAFWYGEVSAWLDAQD